MSVRHFSVTQMTKFRKNLEMKDKYDGMIMIVINIIWLSY